MINATNKLDVFQIDNILTKAGVKNVKQVTDYLHLNGADRRMVDFYIRKVVRGE